MKTRELLKTMQNQTGKELLVTLLLVLAVVPFSIPVFLMVAPIVGIYLGVTWLIRYIKYKKTKMKNKAIMKNS